MDFLFLSFVEPPRLNPRRANRGPLAPLDQDPALACPLGRGATPGTSCRRPPSSLAVVSQTASLPAHVFRPTRHPIWLAIPDLASKHGRGKVARCASKTSAFVRRLTITNKPKKKNPGPGPRGSVATGRPGMSRPRTRCGSVSPSGAPAGKPWTSSAPLPTIQQFDPGPARGVAVRPTCCWQAAREPGRRAPSFLGLFVLQPRPDRDHQP